MSQADAKSFLERVVRDPALRQAAMTELGGKTAPTSRRVIELGGRHGLIFNEAELRTAWEEQQRSMGGSEVSGAELDDAELDSVSGGVGIDPNAIIRQIIKALGDALRIPARTQ